MRILIAICLATFAALTCGCATNPVTGEAELRLISTAQEVEMGGRIDAQVRQQYRVESETAAAERVGRLGQRVAAVSDRQDIQYHFALIDSPELNAFAAPGGYVYVTKELVNAAGDDAELAAVIAHEVGHVAAFHSVNEMQRRLGYDIFRSLMFGDADSPQAVQAADAAFNGVVMTGFSREDEYEADRLGVKYAAKAGYDPYGLANFFVKLEERQRQGIVDRAFEFLMSHPNTEDRRRKAEKEAARYAGRAG